MVVHLDYPIPRNLIFVSRLITQDSCLIPFPAEGVKRQSIVILTLSVAEGEESTPAGADSSSLSFASAPQNDSI